MKKITFLIIIVVLNSCSLFTNKTKILTENTWILSSISNRKNGIHQQYFKKTEKELVFNFFVDGTLEIIEKNHKIPAHVNWKFDTKEQKKIIISHGKFSGELRIFTLDKNRFSFLQYENNSFSSTDYEFLSQQSKEWYEDEFVDGYRSAKQKYEEEKRK